MGLLDVLRGRTKQAPPNLDQLFALPGAAVTLQTACALVPTGRGGICFKAGVGTPGVESASEIDQLLAEDADPASIRRVEDDLGFTWIVVDDADLSSLVTRLHGANQTLEEHGLGANLLCAVVGLTDAAGTEGKAPVYLVYLFKQGTWYPFAPRPEDRRDNDLELSLRAQLEGDLPIEQDLSRWLALWGLPVAS